MTKLHKIVDGEIIYLSDTEVKELEKEWQANREETLKNDYQSKRRREYPTEKEQFDILYHQGFDAWKAKIAEIKAKYPKPN